MLWLFCVQISFFVCCLYLHRVAICNISANNAHFLVLLLRVRLIAGLLSRFGRSILLDDQSQLLVIVA
jgi:hypothetical protein